MSKTSTAMSRTSSAMDHCLSPARARHRILREADIRTGENRLGPLGGRLVAEVLIGLLRNDSTSLLNAGAHWRPNFGRSDQTSLAQLFAWAESAP